MPFNSDAIVKIIVEAVTPDYLHPTNSYNHTLMGTGFIIDGWILTSAHVVNHTADLHVKIRGKSVPVKVAICAYDCDLALLKCKDPEALKGIAGLQLSDEQMLLGAEVVYAGFPEVKEAQTRIITNISQIDSTSEYNLPQLLTLKLLFEVKPGGSGGPILYKDKVIGVAYKFIGNFTHAIPLPFIKRLLNEVRRSNSYKGIPDLGLAWQSTDDPDQGVRVMHVDACSKIKDFIRPNDYLLTINGLKIRNDGKIECAETNEQVFLNHAVHTMVLGETVEFTLLRDKKPTSVSAPLNRRIGETLLCPYKFDNRTPDYFFWDGLLIQPLTANLIYALQKQNCKFFDEYLFVKQSQPHQQVVVLRKIFGATPAAHDFENSIIESINGIKIQNFITAMHALQESTTEHTIITHNPNLPPLQIKCLSAAENAEQRKKYRIPDVYPEHLSPVASFRQSPKKQEAVEEKQTVVGEPLPFSLFAQSSEKSGNSSPRFGKLSPATSGEASPFLQLTGSNKRSS